MIKDKPRSKIICKKLLAWYKSEGRNFPWRDTQDKFKVLVSEIFLQKTQTTNVLDLYPHFFKKYRGFKDLRDVSMEELKDDVMQLGLVNKRSKILKRVADFFTPEVSSPSLNTVSVDKLQEIKGIGQYVAKAYACFGRNEQVYFWDVNVKRVLGRVFQGSEVMKKKSELKQTLLDLVPRKDPKNFYWAVLDLGALVCKKRDPMCHKCPLVGRCEYAKKYVNRANIEDLKKFSKN